MIPLGILASSVRRAASGALLAPTNLVATLVEPTLPDPHWDNVVALLHFDGDFVDQRGNTMSAVGTAGFGLGKFSSAMTLTSGDSGTSQPANTSTLDLPADFTIEGWVKPDAGSSGAFISRFDVGSEGTGWQIYMDTSGQMSFYQYVGSGSYPIRYVGPDLRDWGWHHVAVSREGRILRMFVDGVLVGTGDSSVNYTSTVGRLSIGYQVQGAARYPMRGSIDEVRITKGVARYTEDFTPPTEPFPNFGPEPTPTPLPTVIGEAYGGGFYAGDIEYPDGQWYKLIVADVSAEITGANSQWKTTASDTPGTDHEVDGVSNTASMVAAGIELHPAAAHCIDHRGGGNSDWYMPANDELNVIYQNLGLDRPNCPPHFLRNEPQAFKTNTRSSLYYWTSSQYSETNGHRIRFSDGFNFNGPKDSTGDYVRPVRRIPFTPD